MFSYPVLCALLIGVVMTTLGLGDTKLLREHFNWRLFSYVSGAFAVAAFGLSGQQSVWYNGLLSEGYVPPGEVSALKVRIKELEGENADLTWRVRDAESRSYATVLTHRAWPAFTRLFSFVEDDGERCYPLDDDLVLSFDHNPCYFQRRSFCAYPECPWCEEQ